MEFSACDQYLLLKKKMKALNTSLEPNIQHTLSNISRVTFDMHDLSIIAARA